MQNAYLKYNNNPQYIDCKETGLKNAKPPQEKCPKKCCKKRSQGSKDKEKQNAATLKNIINAKKYPGTIIRPRIIVWR